jgi:hypothetical protein
VIAPRAVSGPQSPLRNDQFALLALLMLGGEMDAVDTEDVAIRVDTLAPGRFRWRKYKEHIDLGLVRNGLQDSRKKQLVTGGALAGWRLTAAGAQEAKQLAEQNSAMAHQSRLTPEQKKWRMRERERVIRDPAYRAARSVGSSAVPDADILRFFKFDEYLSADRRADRVHRLLVAFEGDAEVHDVIEQFARRLNL